MYIVQDSFFISSHIGIADSLPTTAYVKMIDIFMIFTMIVPLLEIIGHTYSVYLKKKIEELDSLHDPPKPPLTSPPTRSVSVSIQPLGLDGDKLVLPQIKSQLYAHDKRLGALLLGGDVKSKTLGTGQKFYEDSSTAMIYGEQCYHNLI